MARHNCPYCFDFQRSNADDKRLFNGVCTDCLKLADEGWLRQEERFFGDTGIRPWVITSRPHHEFWDRWFNASF